MKTTYWKPSKRSLSQDELHAFAKRLFDRMHELGMTQSDLARAAFGVNEAGQVLGRDKISIYLRGKGFPGEAPMKALANALKMGLNDLAPLPQAEHPGTMYRKAGAPAGPAPLRPGVQIIPNRDGRTVQLTASLPSVDKEVAAMYASQLMELLLKGPSAPAAPATKAPTKPPAKPPAKPVAKAARGGTLTIKTKPSAKA